MIDVAVKIAAEFAGHIRSAVSARAAIGGAAVKTAGGTEELHSRSGRVGFNCPCQLAALSGRRAAQDGCGRALGGPERAGMEGLGEALSAGRAAAPDQFPRETLGRGRSADRVAHVLAERAKPGGSCGHGEAARASARARRYQAMARAVFSAVAAVGLFVSLASAENFVKPGDTGTIELPLKNDVANVSAGKIENVTVSVAVPAQFQDHFTVTGITLKNNANTPPTSFELDEAKTFVIAYTIGANIPEGSFEAVLTVNTPDQAVGFTPAGRDTSVRFRIVDHAFSTRTA